MSLTGVATCERLLGRVGHVSLRAPIRSRSSTGRAQAWSWPTSSSPGVDGPAVMLITAYDSLQVRAAARGCGRCLSRQAIRKCRVPWPRPTEGCLRGRPPWWRRT